MKWIFAGTSLSLSSPTVGKTDIAAENTSVLNRTAFNALESVLITPASDEEEVFMLEEEPAFLRPYLQTRTEKH